ncbi:hypothetical protein THAOC_10749 [Thalassiosira oceanica]|uniref:Uncharacterized protein n=1 Tax=Thalassiosira oceanica TaxID=159749 RepID=K0SRT4_THAOC|nr:hypothetical protein THAOC_10749 [Thalassiosira oceanica]|eukprot:EJK68105.1 hypothetical protein THAOC_10749 [Thalassiosira oceanica]
MSGICERYSTTELTAEEMEEGEANLRSSVRSRDGESLGELEACVEVSSMPSMPSMPIPRNDAADARLAPEEEIPIYDGIVVQTVWTRLQTLVEHFQNNPPTPPPPTRQRSTYNPSELAVVLVITLVIIVGIIVGVFVGGIF